MNMTNILDNNLFSFFFIILISLLILHLCLDLFVKKRFIKKYGNNSPVVPYLPIIGSLHLLLIDQDFLRFLQGHWKQLKEPFFLWAFYTPYYFTNDSTEIKEILTNPNTMEKGFPYEFVKPSLGDSLLTVETTIWKKNRRILSKTFAQKPLDSFVPIIDKRCDKLINTIQTKYIENYLEIMERAFLDTFMETLCNLKLEELAVDTSKYFDFDLYNCIKILEKGGMDRIKLPWYYPDVIFFNTKRGKEYIKINQAINGVLNDIIEDRRKNYVEEKEASEDKNSSLLDLLIETNMTNDEIIGEIKLFGTAAAQTSGFTVTLALILLAMHPDIQEKLLKEVLEVIGHDGPVTHRDILNLKYTEMVLNETLRLFPSVPLICRLVSADVNIGEKLLPKGTNIVIDIFQTQRSEKYWKDPLKFDPDRFLPSEIDKRPPFSFLPLSAGPKNCIGGKYSMIVMKTALSKIIRSYNVTSKIKSIQDIKLEQYFTLLLKNVDCVLSPRE